MEAIEAKVDVNQIVNQFGEELNNESVDTKSTVENPKLDKPRLNIGPTYVKLFCRGENFFLFRMATRDVPLDVKEKLAPLIKTTDEEIKLTKEVIDYYGTDHLSPEWVEMINKYSNTPLAPLIHLKMDQYNSLRAQAKLEMKNKEEAS